MNSTPSRSALWQRFRQYYIDLPELGLALDLSRVNFPDDYFARMAEPIQRAFAAMSALEKGAIANKDENRMVGHYWLRNSALAPTEEFRKNIDDCVAKIAAFAGKVRNGEIQGARGPFKHVLLIGIGGSALGPQFVSQALGTSEDPISLWLFDNTDPDGMDRVLDGIRTELGQTLCIVISKSGGTKETENGCREAARAYKAAGLDFAKHVVAITMPRSKLADQSQKEGWLESFPIWDWVGGRTSETSAVGLLPAALQGIDIGRLLEGAKACDEVTRNPDAACNPAACLALMWYYLTNGRGEKDMVVLPYKDRLELFSRYLQQLVMESLGKELDVDGNVVNQGITVYGNKGSTDQHAYVQQLREGVHNFFVVFIEVLKDRNGESMFVEPQVTSGDFLSGFYLGTREALFEKGRQSITITVREVSPFTVGALIALFERTVGLYASLININAYHQPGVEAGKKAAGKVIERQLQVLSYLAGYASATAGHQPTAEEIARAIGFPDEVETVFKICEHLAANPSRGVTRNPGAAACDSTYHLPSGFLPPCGFR